MLVIALQGAGLVHLCGGDAPILAGKGQHLVACGFNCTSLVNVDVACIGAQCALPGAKRGGNDGCVGLCTAHQEMHIGIGDGEERAHKVCGVHAVRIQTVARGLLEIGGGEGLQNSGMTALEIIAVHADHAENPLSISRITNK